MDNERKEYIKICKHCLKRFEHEIRQKEKYYDIEVVPSYNCKLSIIH